MTRRLVMSVAAVLTLWACDQTMPAQPDTEPQMSMVPVSVSAAPGIGTLTITVSASDIPSDLVFNVTMTNGEATDTITIPAGSARTITVRGYDASNIETHRGSKTVNLTEGLNPQLTVVLQGLTGDQPLVVVLGETTVAVSPETATVSVGGTTQLAAVVTDEAGDTLDVSVRWASSHPAVVTVDDAGLVSGVSLGSTSVTATYAGLGASAAVTVSEVVLPTNESSLVFTPGNYVRIPSDPVLQGLVSFTLEFWTFIEAIQDESIIGTEFFATGWQFYPGTWAGIESEGVWAANSGAHAQGPSLTSTGVWYHVAMVYDDALTENQWKLFLDGQLVEQQSINLGLIGDGQDVVINRHTWASGSSSRLSGKIDEVRVSDVARYSASFSPPTIRFATDAHTLLLLHFDEMSGGSILDSSGNGLDGSVVGSVTWSADTPMQAVSNN